MGGRIESMGLAVEFEIRLEQIAIEGTVAIATPLNDPSYTTLHDAYGGNDQYGKR